MKKTSQIHIKYLVLTLAIVFLLSVGVNLLMSYAGIGSIGSSRSGMFTNTSQSISRSGWYFYAEKANGHSTFFADLCREELENIVVESQILKGEVNLVITQEDIQLIYVLISPSKGVRELEHVNHYTKVEPVKKEIDASEMEPGRIEMRLYFIYAENVDVVLSWRN